MTMTIQGNNNTQVSGNLTENHYHGQHTAEIPLDHPHRVLCPQCNKATLRFNEYCGNGPCTYGIRLHFAEIERQRLADEQRRQQEIRVKRIKSRLFKLFIFSVVIIIAGSYMAKNQIFGLSGHIMAILGLLLMALWAKAQE